MNMSKNKKIIISVVVFLGILVTIISAGFFIGRNDRNKDSLKKIDETVKQIDDNLSNNPSDEDLNDDSLGLASSEGSLSTGSSVSNSKLDAASTKQINDLGNLLDASTSQNAADNLGLSDSDLGI